MPEARASTASAPTSISSTAPRRRSIGADVLAIVTEWKEFRSPDFERMRDALRHKVIFDGRNLVRSRVVRSFGLTYHGIGRGVR